MARSTMDTVLGIVLIVLGAAALLDWLDLGFIVTIAAVAAIVVGILVLMGKFSGSTVFGVVLIIVGVLLLAPNLIGNVLGSLLETIAAVVLLVLGILKLMGKW